MYSIISNLKNIFQKKYLCKAPFNSIYISGDGSVTTCCFNRTEILGNIYDTPLKEILNNSKTFELRKNIEQGIFPNGCSICKNHSENGNRENSGITTYEHYTVIEDYLSIIEFELSYKCNLRCSMCKLNDENLFVNPSKTGNKKFQIIEQIKPYLENVKLLRFYGGEPFFIEEYYSIWETVIEINPKCRFIIQTNGTILNQRVKEITSKGLFNFNMSLDSLDKQTYELIRIGANFEKSMSNLFSFREIAKKNGQTMSISVCPMRINWKEIPQIIEFSNNNKLYVFFNSVFSPWNMAIWSMSETELLEIISYYKTFKFFRHSKISLVNNHRWNSFLKQLQSWYELAKKRPKLTTNELDEAKFQIFNLLKDKTETFNMNNNLMIDYKNQQLKIYNSLNEILKFISVSTLVEKIKNSDAETIYNKVIDKEEFEIKENIITL